MSPIICFTQEGATRSEGHRTELHLFTATPHPCRCAKRGAGHWSSRCSPHQPRPTPGPRGADPAPVSRERLAPPGMQGALGNSVGAPRCPAPRLRPESNSTPRAPLRGARPPARRTFALCLALGFAPEEVFHIRHGSSV